MSRVHLRVRDNDGLHQVILFVKPKNPFLGGTVEVKACKTLAGETDTVVEFDFDGKLPSDNVGTAPEAHTTLSNTNRHPIAVISVDTDGNSTDIINPISFTLVAGHSPDFPVSERTPQVRDAIVTAAPGSNSADDVTDTHLAEIRVLNLSGKSITSLKAGDFDGLSGLQVLYLQNNPLTALPADVFDGLSALTQLNLGANQLTALPADVFDGLSALTQLSLGGNPLTALPADVFDGLSALTQLDLAVNQQLTALPADVFDGLSALSILDLRLNGLTSLPANVFNGLSALTRLWLVGNAVDPIPFTISLEKVADGQFKAVAPAGAPFDIVLPISITNGSINGGASSITISKGTVESGTLTVTRTPGTTAAVTVDIGTLPGVPANHNGYALRKSTTHLPLAVIAAPQNSAPVFTDGTSTTRTVAENTAANINIGTVVSATDADTGDMLTYTLGGTDAASFSIISTTGQLQTRAALDYETKTSYSVTVSVSDGNGGSSRITVTINVTDVVETIIDPPLSQRTPQVRDAIVEAVPGVNSAADVTKAHLAAITGLRLGRITLFGNTSGEEITTLQTGDFDGLTGMTILWVNGEQQLSNVPADIFDGLISLKTLGLTGNFSSLPDGVFDELTALTFLSVASFQLDSLRAGVFDELTALDNTHCRWCSVGQSPCWGL